MAERGMPLTKLSDDKTTAHNAALKKITKIKACGCFSGGVQTAGDDKNDSPLCAWFPGLSGSRAHFASL